MEERYLRSLGALTEEELAQLRTKRVCVLGCGGLGGYAVELLARLGVGALTVVDGDFFARSNLNRQLLADEGTLGTGKAQTAAERVRSINPDVRVAAVPQYLTEENADELLRGHDLVIDALDSIAARRIAAAACDRLGLPLVHGAISGWCAQVAVILPGSGALEKIYPAKAGETPAPSSLSFTPALAASVQAAEAVKLLVCRQAALQSRLLLVDLLTLDCTSVAL